MGRAQGILGAVDHCLDQPDNFSGRGVDAEPAEDQVERVAHAVRAMPVREQPWLLWWFLT